MCNYIGDSCNIICRFVTDFSTRFTTLATFFATTSNYVVIFSTTQVIFILLPQIATTWRSVQNIANHVADFCKTICNYALGDALPGRRTSASMPVYNKKPPKVWNISFGKNMCSTSKKCSDEMNCYPSVKRKRPNVWIHFWFLQQNNGISPLCLFHVSKQLRFYGHGFHSGALFWLPATRHYQKCKVFTSQFAHIKCVVHQRCQCVLQHNNDGSRVWNWTSWHCKKTSYPWHSIPAYAPKVYPTSKTFEHSKGSLLNQMISMVTWNLSSCQNQKNWRSIILGTQTQIFKALFFLNGCNWLCKEGFA